MTDFTIKITDASQLAGITFARERYNAGLPKAVLASDEDYVAFVVMQAASSYAKDRMNGKVDEAIVAAEVGDLSKLDAVRAEYAAKSK